MPTSPATAPDTLKPPAWPQRLLPALAARLRGYVLYHGLWAPGVRLLRRLSLRGKAVLLLSLMGLPTLWLVSEAVLARWQAYDVAVLGREGVQLHVQVATLQQAAGQPDNVEEARFAALQARLQPWLAAHPQTLPAWAAVELNLLWVVGSVGLVAAGWLPLTVLGTVFVLAQAVGVLSFVALQMLGLRRAGGGQRAATASTRPG